ncbi:MAG: heparinase II/III family protein [Proteobacteria bacterium]|nr:heparinase II/III family protein [Pseudomonadota bacterium]
MHRRTWTMTGRGLEVQDMVNGGVASVARYHLAPGLRAVEGSSGQWKILDGDRVVAGLDVRKGRCRALPGEQALAFGVLVPAATLEVTLAEGQSVTCWSW